MLGSLSVARATRELRSRRLPTAVPSLHTTTPMLDRFGARLSKCHTKWTTFTNCLLLSQTAHTRWYGFPTRRTRTACQGIQRRVQRAKMAPNTFRQIATKKLSAHTNSTGAPPTGVLSSTALGNPALE